MRWQEALAELTGKVYSSPTELTGALLAAIQELYEAAGLTDDADDGAIPSHCRTLKFTHAGSLIS